MPLIQEWTDLRALSNNTNLSFTRNDRVVLGDMHCNPIYLLNKLHQLGMLEIDDPAYKTMATHYYDLLRVYEDKVDIDVPAGSTYTAEKNNLIQKIMYQFAVLLPIVKLKSKPACLTLLGDLFADRGPNDFLMMIVLNYLVKLEIPLEINLSNHDYQYICWVEDQCGDLNHWVQHSGCANSLVHFKALLDKFIYSTNWAKKFFHDVYRPSLKLITYDIVSDDEIILYGHGAFDKRVICSMATFLKVEFKSATVYDLADTIDRIQATFDKLIKNEELYFSTLLPEESALKKVTADFNAYPFLHLLWNRPEFSRRFEANRGNAIAQASVAGVFISEADDFANFKTTILHGHDTEDGPGSLSLDSSVGKFHRVDGETKSFVTPYRVRAVPTKTSKDTKINRANQLYWLIEAKLEDWQAEKGDISIPQLRIRTPTTTTNVTSTNAQSIVSNPSILPPTPENLELDASEIQSAGVKIRSFKEDMRINTNSNAKDITKTDLAELEDPKSEENMIQFANQFSMFSDTTVLNKLRSHSRKNQHGAKRHAEDPISTEESELEKDTTQKKSKK